MAVLGMAENALLPIPFYISFYQINRHPRHQFVSSVSAARSTVAILLCDLRACWTEEHQDPVISPASAFGVTSTTFGKIGLLFHVTDLREKAFSFSLFNLILAVSLTYIYLIILRYVLTFLICSEFVLGSMVEFH